MPLYSRLSAGTIGSMYIAELIEPVGEQPNALLFFAATFGITFAVVVIALVVVRSAVRRRRQNGE